MGYETGIWDRNELVELIRMKRRRRRGAEGPTSYRQIGRELNFEDVPALRGGEWSDVKVRRMLLDEEKRPARKKQVRKMQLAWDDYLRLGQIRQIRKKLQESEVSSKESGELLFIFDGPAGERGDIAEE